MTHYRYSEDILRPDFVQINRKPLSKPKPISLHKRKVPFLRKPYIYHVALINAGCDSGIVEDVRQCLTAVGYCCCHCRSDGQQPMKETTGLIHKSQWIVIVTSDCSDDTYSMLVNTAVTTAKGRKQKCIISLVTEKSLQEQFPRELDMFLQVQMSSSSWKNQMLSLLENRPTLLQGGGFRLDKQGRQWVHRTMSFTNLPVRWLPRCLTSVGELNQPTTSLLPYTFRKTKTEDLPPLDNVGPTQNGHQEKDSGGDVVSPHGDNSENITNANADPIKMSPHQNQANPNPENTKLPEITLQKHRTTFKMLEHDADRCLISSTFKIDHRALISARRRPYLCSLPLDIPDYTPDKRSRTRVTHPSSTEDGTPTRQKPRQTSVSFVKSCNKAHLTEQYAFERQRRLHAVTPRPVLFIYGLAKHNE